MTKYRIRIETYENGRKTYFPEVYRETWLSWLFGNDWVCISYKGEEYEYYTNIGVDTEKRALEYIGLHKEGNEVVRSVEIKEVI